MIVKNVVLLIFFFKIEMQTLLTKIDYSLHATMSNERNHSSNRYYCIQRKKGKMGNYLYLLLDKIEEIAQVAGKINAVNRKCPIFLHVYH